MQYLKDISQRKSLKRVFYCVFLLIKREVQNEKKAD